MAFLGKKKREERVNDDVIVDEVRVSVSDLKKKVNQANRRFWGLLCSLVLISSMILPYMSNAAVAGQDSDAFTGIVVPGYSMGGLEITAYGIDINDWGKVKTDKAIKSNYGVWSGERGINAYDNLNKSGTFVALDEKLSANYNLTGTDKSLGWQGITGKTGYTSSNPDGLAGNNQSEQTDMVSPYRTVNDFNYWTSQTPRSGDNASASITVSLFPDFIVVALDEHGNVVVPQSADDYRAQAKSNSLFKNPGQTTESLNQASDHTHPTTADSNSAIPYYIPLKSLFDAYNITNPSETSINFLMEQIRAYPDTMKQVVGQTNDLLDGTSYTSLNSDETRATEDSFNPYPYSMVFSTQTENGQVVSSIYENSEAYVYFSPASAYSSYMKLKQEYENLRSAGATPLENHDQVTTFQLGYYLAGMAILEAYLNEALPQDMTRGYVGPSETPAIARASKKSGPGQLASGASAVSPSQDKEKIAAHAYSLLMYDYARSYLSDIGGGSEYKLGQTNAIMDTLSVYGYSSPYENPGPGIMKGLTAKEAQGRPTLMTDSENDARATKETHNSTDNNDIGIYTPVYYPIQQHKMPDAEKPYRFQILATVPYETVLTYIKDLGFGGNVNFTYSSSQVKSRTNTGGIRTVEQYKEAVAGLADMYEKAEETGGGPKVTEANSGRGDMLALNAAGDEGSSATYNEENDESAAKRADNALLGYYASNMTADNVHDLFDVVRSTKGLKYETWFRYYNPVKSEGGDMDLFVTRVSPALNVYMPSILINGYTCSGSGYINDTLTTTNCSFDYYSTPSFAPCFATHTTDDCYYGIMNYEQRVFYSRAFLDSLPRTGIGIPAVELVELADEAMQEVTAAEKLDAEKANKNIAALWIMGKRLAAIKTANALKLGGAPGKFIEENMNGNNIRSYAARIVGGDTDSPTLKKPEGISSMNFSPILTSAGDVNISALQKVANSHGGWLDNQNPEDFSGDDDNTSVGGVSSTNGFTSEFKMQDGAKFTVRTEVSQTMSTSGVEYSSKTWTTYFDENGNERVSWDNKQPKDLTEEELSSCYGSQSTGNDAPPRGKFSSIKDYSNEGFNTGLFNSNKMWLKAVEGDGDKYGSVEAGFGGEDDFGRGGDRGFTGFSDSPSPSDGINEGDFIVYLAHDNQSPYLQVSRSLYFSAIYDSILNGYFGENGSYYWEDMDKMVELAKKNKPEINADNGGSVFSGEHKKFTVGFNAGDNFLSGKKIGDGDVQTAYEELMADCASELQKYVENMRQDMKTIADSMPTQMQNCLAWADYQNSSDSEYQYQVDPSDANVTVNVSTNVEQTQYGAADRKVLSIKDLEAGGYTWSENEGVYAQSDAGAKNGVDTSRDARMVRGVEGSTWTSTQLPALYTMTATIARVTALAQTTGTNYPYSGIANGRLMSGTDRYALMQAHVIDYASIASGIAGDLALRQKINVVKVTNPEYSTIPNFFDIIGSIGGVFGELGKGALTATAGWFTSMFWTSSSSSGLATSANINGTTAPAGVYAGSYDNGIIMNRVPASIHKFDVDTGTMKTGNISDYSVASGSGSSIASAAGVTKVENIAAPWLLRQGAGLYQMLQSFGLILVMICLTIVAFQNFLAYSSVKGSSDSNMIDAQRQLKTVLPRAIFAIFMIGLPPVGNSIGFEGGAYILLQLLGNVIAYIASIFTSVDGSGIMGLWTSMDVSGFGNDLFAYLGFFLFALILSVLFIIGTAAIFIQSLALFAYYLVGPIIWAFYVWPTGTWGDGIVNKFPLSLFTKNGDGQNRGAAKAWVIGYVSLAGLTALWSVMFWLISLMFVSTVGVGASGAATGRTAELFVNNSGYPSASASLLEDGIFTNVGVPEPVKYILLLLIALLLFGLMARTTLNGIRAAATTAKAAGMQMYNTTKKNVNRARSTANTVKDLADRASGNGKPYGEQTPETAGGEDLGKKKDAIIANANQAVINTGTVGKADGLAKGRGATTKKGANIPLAPAAAAAPAVAAATAPLAAASDGKKKEDGKLLKGLQKGADAIGGARDALASGELRRNKRKLDAANEVSNALEKAKNSTDKDERKALLDGMSADAKNLAEKLGVSKNGELVEGKALDEASEKAGKYQNKLQKKSDDIANRLAEHDGQAHSDTYNKVRGGLERKMAPVLEAADRVEDLSQRALASGLESRKTVEALDKAEDRKYNWQGTDYSTRTVEEARNDLEAASNDLASGYLDAFDNEKAMSAQEKYERTKSLIEGRFGSLISDDTAATLQSAIDAGNAGMLTDAERNSLMAYNAMNNVAGALMPEAAAEAVPGLDADPGFQQALNISRERNSLMEAANSSKALMPAAVDVMEASLNPESMSDAMSDFFANSKNWDNMADMLDGISKADANPEQFGLSREEADKLVSNSQMFKDGSWIEAADGAGAEFREKALTELGTEGYEKALGAAEDTGNLFAGIDNSIAAAAFSDNSTLQKQAAVAMEYGAAGMANAAFDALSGAAENTSYEDVYNSVAAQLGGQTSEANAAYAQAVADYEESLELSQAYRAAGNNLSAIEEQYGTASPEYGEAKAALYEAEQAYAAVADVNSAAAARDEALAIKQRLQKEAAETMAILDDNGEAIYNDMHKVAYGVGVNENFIGSQSFGAAAQTKSDFATLAPPSDGVLSEAQEAPVVAGGAPVAGYAASGYAPIPAPTIADMQLGGNEHVTGEGAIAAETAMAQGFGTVSFDNTANSGFFSEVPSIGPSEETISTARQMQDDAMMMAAQERVDATVNAGLSDADGIRDVAEARRMANDSKIDTIFSNADNESRRMRDMSDRSMNRLEQTQMDIDDNLVDTMYAENDRQVANVRDNSERVMSARNAASDERARRVARAHERAGGREARAVKQGAEEIADEILNGNGDDNSHRKPRRTHRAN